MEVSALKYSGAIGLHGRSRLLRLQSDERLVAFLRKGNSAAFEILVARYESRLHGFCRHLLGSREDAEDVMQEVMAAAFNALLADDRPINVRPWLYRIARNRSLNHLRRIQSIGVDSMDVHLSDHGASTADKVHEREEFRLLVGDIHELPETQKTALVLREMDALSYEQIAEAMETTVPSVKSLLVRARVSLAEAAEARLLSCDEVRIELAEVSEGLRRRPSPLVRRHLHQCKRCTVFRAQLKQTNKALAALLPIGPTVALHKLLFAHLAHLGHSAASGSGATAAGSGVGAGAAGAGGAGAGAAGAGAAGAGAAGTAAASTAAASSSVVVGGGFVSGGIGAVAAKAAAGLAAAALVTAAVVEVHPSVTTPRPSTRPVAAAAAAAASPRPSVAAARPVAPLASRPERRSATPIASVGKPAAKPRVSNDTAVKVAPPKRVAAEVTAKPAATINAPVSLKAKPPGRTQSQSDPTVLPPPAPVSPGPGPGGSGPGGTYPTATGTTPGPTAGGTTPGSSPGGAFPGYPGNSGSGTSTTTGPTSGPGPSTGGGSAGGAESGSAGGAESGSGAGGAGGGGSGGSAGSAGTGTTGAGGSTTGTAGPSGSSTTTPTAGPTGSPTSGTAGAPSR